MESVHHQLELQEQLENCVAELRMKFISPEITRGLSLGGGAHSSGAEALFLALCSDFTPGRAQGTLGSAMDITGLVVRKASTLPIRLSLWPLKLSLNDRNQHGEGIISIILQVPSLEQSHFASFKPSFLRKIV